MARERVTPAGDLLVRLRRDPLARGRALAWVMTTLMLVAVTKGPIYWVRDELGPLHTDRIDDLAVQLAFLVPTAAVVGACWKSWRRLRHQLAVLLPVAALLVAIATSTAWSIWPARTAQQAAMMIVGTIAAVLAGVTLSRRMFLTALWSAVHVGVALSVWADARDWIGVRDRNGDLAGVFINRNSLGPVAVLALATTLVMLRVVDLGPRLRSWWYGGLVAVGILDVWVCWQAASLTPVLAGALATGATALLRSSGPGPGRRRRSALAATAAGVVVGVIVVAVTVGRSVVTGRLDRSMTFSGRTTIWDVVWSYARRRPFEGYGFLGIWRDPSVLADLSARNRPVFEAHSGYLEVLVGVGAIGLALLVGVLAGVLVAALVVAWREPGPMTWFTVWIVCFVILVNVGESFVGANLLPWTLLCVAAGQTVRTFDARPAGESSSPTTSDGGDTHSSRLAERDSITPPVGVARAILQDFPGTGARAHGATVARARQRSR